MYFVYSLLLGLGFLIMLPRFMLDALRYGKYISSLSERLGSLEKSSCDKKGTIWLHCVSVGEVQAARPLFLSLRRIFPERPIVVSTVTVTGQHLAREVFHEQAARVFFFPIDWRWSVRRTLKEIDPSLVLIMETELWPNFLHECRKNKVPTAIVNGRLSEKSFARYGMVRSFISRVVSCLDLAVMQTKADADRMRQLGLAADRVQVCGNMKFDAGFLGQSQALTEELTDRFQFSKQRPVLIAVSTHDPEERIVLDSFMRLRETGLGEIRLVIAPRHPERFNAVAALLEASKLPWTRRSARPNPGDQEADIVLFDTIGEIKALFPVASLVFVGGSLTPIGGHNVLEPAAAGACIVTGPHTKNFDEIVKTFSAKSALVQIGQVQNGALADTLSKAFADLLRDSQRRSELGARGKALIEENLGATACTIDLISGIIGQSNFTSR